MCLIVNRRNELLRANVKATKLSIVELIESTVDALGDRSSRTHAGFL